MSHRRKTYLGMAAFAAFWGVHAFHGVYTNPRFETIHVLDVIRLMTAGAAVAVTITFLSLSFVRGPGSEDKMAREKSGEESN